MGMHDTLVTLEELAGAIAHRLQLPRDQAHASAEEVLEIFGTHTEVIDNLLENEERQTFYALQMQGLLTVRSDETELWNGQTWRTLSWVLRGERIRALAHEAREAQARAQNELERAAGVYATLPEDVWARRGAAHATY